GSYMTETLAYEFYSEAGELIDQVKKLGGMVKAMVMVADIPKLKI
ncbi:unnamed protein product, partial [Rotaria sp. Silwood2]